MGSAVISYTVEVSFKVNKEEQEEEEEENMNKEEEEE